MATDRISLTVTNDDGKVQEYILLNSLYEASFAEMVYFGF